MDNGIEIIEYEAATIVGIKYNYTIDDPDNLSMVQHLMHQYRLVDNVNMALDAIAHETDSVAERRCLEQYFVVSGEFMLYGIDYNSGFFIPNDWAMYAVDKGLFVRTYIPYSKVGKHIEYMNMAIEFAREKKFMIDDMERPVIYKYAPTKEEDYFDTETTKLDLILNIPIR